MKKLYRGSGGEYYVLVVGTGVARCQSMTYVSLVFVLIWSGRTGGSRVYLRQFAMLPARLISVCFLSRKHLANGTAILAQSIGTFTILNPILQIPNWTGFVNRHMLHLAANPKLP